MPLRSEKSDEKGARTDTDLTFERPKKKNRGNHYVQKPKGGKGHAKNNQDRQEDARIRLRKKLEERERLEETMIGKASGYQAELAPEQNLVELMSTMHQEGLAPEEKLRRWSRLQRLRDPCSFWDAIPVRDGCECKSDGNGRSLSLGCMKAYNGNVFFSPPELMDTFRERGMQLWADGPHGCKCETQRTRNNKKYLEQPLPNEKDLMGLTAIDFCTKVFKTYDARWREMAGDHDIILHEATQGLNSSSCVDALRDEGKEGTLKAGSKAPFWQEALKHICHHECEEIVHEVVKNGKRIMYFAAYRRAASYSEACNNLVVQKVEARLLGCCGDSCGWNGKSCMDWPFIPPQAQLDWKSECCAENGIVKGSERELMCQSVLSNKSATEFAEEDFAAKDENLASFVGEDEELVWTLAGAKSDLGKVGWGRANQVVDDSFLRVQPLSLEEGVSLKLWEVRNKSKQSSLLQVEGAKGKARKQTGDKCNMAALDKNQCSDFFKTVHLDVCSAENNWRYLTTKFPNCLKKNPIPVETPMKCLGQVGSEVKAWYFRYNMNNAEKPVHCYLYTSATKCRNTVKVSKRLFKEDSVELDLNAEQVTFWLDSSN